MAKKKSGQIKVLTASAISKKYSGSGIASNVLKDIELWLPSRFLALNYQWGGGIPYGKIVEIYGEESSGKSLLAYDFAYCAQQLGGVVIWVDAEQAFTKVWAKANGLDLEKTHLFPETAVEKISDFVLDMSIYYRSILTNNEPILLVVDSVASLECIENVNSPQLDAKAEMGNRAKAIDRMLRTRNELLSDLGICSIFINQLRSKIGASKFEDPDTTPGGKALRFYASIRTGIYGGAQIKKKVKGVEKRVGRFSTIRVIKNKVAPPRESIKKAEVYFNPELSESIGFNKYFGLADILLSKGVITKKKGSGRYMLKDKLIANGEEKFLSLLQDDDDLRRKLIRKAGINTISTTQKKLDSITTNLYPIPDGGKEKYQEEDEE